MGTDFQHIFEANKDAVYGFAWRMTGSPAVAEDIAQDCFVELIQAPQRYDAARGSIRALLLGIARNLVLKRWRAEGRWTSIEDEDFRVDPPPNDFQIQEKVAYAVQGLPPLQREVLILTEYYGMTLEEAAGAVGTDVGAVKARLHRARSNLRRSLEPLRSAIHDR
ncbi:MAG TPA: RNA polymerase sigma factor [Bryobacteraceae bacterium]|nr:RNA polymerase sigma factor [Bryobacteraceae bacterium]